MTLEFHVESVVHTAFVVRSLEAALAFWTEGLGASLERRSEMEGDFLFNVTGAKDAQVRTAIVRIAGQEIELLEYRGLKQEPDFAQRPYQIGAMHIALYVDNLDAALQAIDAYGWRPQGIPQIIPLGPRAGTKVVYAVGPDGSAIEFMQPGK